MKTALTELQLVQGAHKPFNHVSVKLYFEQCKAPVDLQPVQALGNFLGDPSPHH